MLLGFLILWCLTQITMTQTTQNFLNQINMAIYYIGLLFQSHGIQANQPNKRSSGQEQIAFVKLQTQLLHCWSHPMFLLFSIPSFVFFKNYSCGLWLLCHYTLSYICFLAFLWFSVFFFFGDKTPFNHPAGFSVQHPSVASRESCR